MLKEERRLALWPSLIGLGSRWQQLVIDAFRRLPVDQIDDGVFEGILDLLNSSVIEVRIRALELLKHGRLKRVPPFELVEAVGRLVNDGDIAVRRRAIHALGDCQSTFAIPVIAKTLEAPLGKASERTTVIDNAIKALVKIGTSEICIPVSRAIASYWHVALLCRETVMSLRGTVRDFIPLLRHSDNLVKWGAIRLLACSSCVEAISVLEETFRESAGPAGNVTKESLLPISTIIASWKSMLALQRGWDYQ